MNNTIDNYIESLVSRHPGIKSIWLFGSRANDSYRENSDWDLLVFADQKIFDALKESKEFYDKQIDLLIVFSATEFAKPWPDEKGSKKGTLPDWAWKDLSSDEATYKSVKYKGDEWFKEDMIESTTLKAVKIWPRKTENKLIGSLIGISPMLVIVANIIFQRNNNDVRRINNFIGYSAAIILLAIVVGIWQYFKFKKERRDNKILFWSIVLNFVLAFFLLLFGPVL